MDQEKIGNGHCILNTQEDIMAYLNGLIYGAGFTTGAFWLAI